MDSQTASKTGVILIDHGSRRAESNELLLEIAAIYRKLSHWKIVEPAHMELAEPTLPQAFDRCVEQGADLVVVFPYFLSPGRHWSQDIPRLAADAAERHPGVRYLVTAALGLHPLLLQVIDQRIERCLQQAAGRAEPCDFCEGHDACRILGAGEP